MKTMFLSLAFTALALVSCRKEDETPASTILTHTITTESLYAKDPGVNNLYSAISKCFINLYDGTAYAKADAITNSSKVDFAYEYSGGRDFENMKVLKSRTGAINDFSTITNAKIVNAEYSHQVKSSDFDNIKTSDDIVNVFTQFKINIDNSTYAYLSNAQDVVYGKVFAFIDKNGKKGFFTVDDYPAKPPAGDKAPITIRVKIQK